MVYIYILRGVGMRCSIYGAAGWPARWLRFDRSIMISPGLLEGGIENSIQPTFNETTTSAAAAAAGMCLSDVQ